MITIEKLDSGITVVHEHKPDVHSVGISIHVKAGPANEKLEERGISHFLEHMNFKGTKTSTSKDISIKLDDLGSFFNAYTSRDTTVYAAQVLDENVNKASDVMIDMFMNSIYDHSEIEKEKKVVIEEMNMVSDDPDDFLFETMNETLFRGTIYEGTILGEEKVIKNLNTQKIIDYRDREYTKDNILLAVYGNCDIYEQIEKFDKALAPLKASKENLKFESLDKTPVYKSIVKDVDQTHLLMAKAVEKTNAKEFNARKLAGIILGGTMSSRLFQKIREEKGLAYSVYSSYYDMAFSDTSLISVGFPNDKVEETIEAIKLEIENMKKQGITKEEFKRAKEILKTSLVFLNEYYSKTFSNYARDLLLYGKTQTFEERFQTINDITMEDVTKEISGLYNSEEYSLFVLSDKKFDLKGFTEK